MACCRHVTGILWVCVMSLSSDQGTNYSAAQLVLLKAQQRTTCCCCLTHGLSCGSHQQPLRVDHVVGYTHNAIMCKLHCRLAAHCGAPGSSLGDCWRVLTKPSESVAADRVTANLALT